MLDYVPLIQEDFMYFRPLIFALLAGALLLACESLHIVFAQANPCDSSLEQDSGPLGYKLRRDGICEGYYKLPVGGGRLELESFIQGTRVDLTNKKETTLMWPAFGKEPVRIRAYSLTPREHYRMDAIRPSGQTSLLWPVDIPVSRKLAIGLVCWTSSTVGNEQKNVYLALRVAGDSSLTSERYRVLLVPTANASEVYVNLSGPNGKKILKDEPLNLGNYPAFQSISYALPDLKFEGIYYAEFGATLQNGTSAVAKMYFYYPGQKPQAGR